MTHYMTPPTAIPAAGASSALSTGEQEPLGDVLTPRQFEVVRRFAHGQKWPVICREMHISRSTLSDHRKDALDRTGSATMNEVWMKLGWLNVPEEAV